MRRIPVFAAFLSAALAAPALAQQSGTFLIRLGRDTTAVEQFNRTATHLEGDGLYRQPRTVVRHFSIDFGADGRPTHAEIVTRIPGAPASAAPVQRIVMTFTRDSVVAENRRDTSTVTRRLAAPQGVLPIWGNAASSFVMFEMMVGKLRAARNPDSLAIPMYGGGTSIQTWGIKPMGRDSVWLYDANDVFHAKVDGNGRILGAVPLSGTQQFSVERIASADINALAASFAARDQSGQSLGLLSPRDTVRATVGGAALMIDYSRPAKRGRTVFGSTVVPWGEIWRVGANAATQFRTDKALEIGGVTLPAGFYTLWAIPSPTTWRLVINSQTGQWGTAHDPSKDLYSLDMGVAALGQAVERFTISVTPSGSNGGVINLDWDTTRASIPFTVR
ncbi:MAG TPA: DUF2911 domain-containing protein [Gemmatimonadales bacterium]|jgi:hypothetical protein